MKRWTHTVRLVAALTLGLLMAGTAQAAFTCGYQNGNPYGNGAGMLQVPLVNAFTVGADVPNGTVLLDQAVISQHVAWGCTNLGLPGDDLRPAFNFKLTMTPHPLAIGWAGQYAGHVYETGVPGIGVVIRAPTIKGDLTYPAYVTDDIAFPCAASCGGNNYIASYTLPDTVAIMELIKTGPVSPGAIAGVDLPSLQFDFAPRSSSGSVPLVQASFTGSINIVAQTCTTPDVMVDMGRHATSVFTGAGSATPWKNFNIELRNCPAFYGYGGMVNLSDTPAGWSYEFARWSYSNVISLTLAPTTAIIDDLAGIVALTPAAAGPAAATGIGLQIWRQPAEQPVSYNTPLPSGITPQTTDGLGYSIPLRARYVQTGSAAPTPGPANTAITFTITYR